VRGGERSEVCGLAVRFGGAADSKVVHLPYRHADTVTSAAFAMEHNVIRERLLNAVSSFPGVTVLERSRITAVEVDPDLRHQKRASVRLSSPAGEMVLRTRLLVGADGASSPVSRLAGIIQSRERVSTLFGFLLQGKPLPNPGFGHVFLGGSGPVLAYAVSKSAVRIMFDVPDSSGGPRRAEACLENLHALPEPFRGEVAQRLEKPGIVASASYRAAVREVTRGRLVLVGDAAGCCHPLTATGLTVCARDALRLRDALRDTGGDIEGALPLYATRRKGPQRIRMMLAQALYEVFCAQTPESRLVRDGLRKYWDGNSQRREKSLALVSTENGRASCMLMELAQVLLCTFGTRISQVWRRESSPPETGVLLGLSRLLLRHAGESLRIS